jgi:hypothetical protein
MDPAAALLLLFRVHRQHALGDQEALKILTEANTSATKPKARAQIGPDSLATNETPTASSAPTTITDDIALVTDISGVCSAGVTDHTT